MGVRPITNASERVAKRILGGTLAKTGWAFVMKIRLQDVLDLKVSDNEWSMYTTGHFDFVVCHSSDDVPVFAIEIDGLSHQSPKQVGLDIIKNRLCAAAGLPLLRLGLDSLDESEQISVLEWILERFLSWQESGSDYRADPLSPFVHHIAWAFPGNPEIVTRLINHFGIACWLKDLEFYARNQVFKRHWLVQAADLMSVDAPYRLDVEWPGQLPTFENAPVSELVVGEVKVGLRHHAADATYLFRATGRAGFAWAHKTHTSEPVPPHPLIPSPEQMRMLGVHAPSLPWFDSSGVAEELALYNALSKVEHWAAVHLGSPPLQRT